MDEPRNGPGEPPEASLDPRWAHLASPPNHLRWDLGERAVLDGPRERLCVVRAAGLALGVRGNRCRGLETLAEPTPIPLAPAHVPGLVHVRGRILPVVDLAPLVGAKSRPWGGDEPDTGLIVALPDGEICLRVDEVLSFDSVASEDLAPYAGDELGPLGDLVFEAWAREDGSFLPLLDPSAVLQRLRLGTGEEDP